MAEEKETRSEEMEDDKTSLIQPSFPLTQGPSSRPCVYLKNKTCSMIQKLVTMAKCSAQSRKLAVTMTEELKKCLPADMNFPSNKLLDCSSCDGYMTHPVCLPCGHSLCQLCLDKSTDTIICPTCHDSCPVKPVGFTTPRKPTILLQSWCVKRFPNEVECCKWRGLGNKYAKENNFHMSIQYYNKAVETGVLDHRVFSNRSRAFIGINDASSALHDADQCCLLKPFWPKGHYRRGIALDQLGQLNEAAAAYLLSLHLGGVDQSVPKLLCQVLESLTKKSSSINQQHLILTVVSIAIERLAHYQKSLPYKEEEGLLEIDESDFECVLCTCLLYNPVTVPCGHSFCQLCLARLFDHSPYCPVCRSSLGEMFAQYTHSTCQMSIDQTLHNLISSHFPKLYEEKKTTIEQELLRQSQIGLVETEEIPIFICTVGYPGMSCPLHVFEPRYRLMIRRCIECNSRRFGICAPTDDTGMNFVDVGTVMFISSLEYTPDGRCLITTIGERRFNVIERSTRDGYAVARIRFITDEPIEESLHQTQVEVYQHCHRWLQALPLFTRLKVMQNVCSPPHSFESTQISTTDGPTWVWWYINAIPATLDTKLYFLRMTSLRQRLLALKEILPLPPS